MSMKECKHCGITFDLNSTAKKQAGGRINECPDCVEELGTETAVKYLGLSSGHWLSQGQVLPSVRFTDYHRQPPYASRCLQCRQR